MSLGDKQLMAIDLLVAGKKRVEIEAEVKISHTQLFRWTHDREFIDRWEQERADRHQERTERLWALSDQAMGVVEQSLDEGDPQAAVAVVKLTARGLVDVRSWELPEHGPSGSKAAPRALKAGEAAHECVTCGKRCTTKGALASHERTHQG